MQLFSCASGVYLLGTERHFSPDNNLVISKMLDEEGENAQRPPAPLPHPLCPGGSVGQPSASAPQSVSFARSALSRGFALLALLVTGHVLNMSAKVTVHACLLPAHAFAGKQWSVPTRITQGLSVVR